VFRIHHGTSLGSYVRRLRLEWASRQLVAGDLPLCDIAAQAGFADQAHFTRAFREYAGVPPGRFRSMVRHDPHRSARDLLPHSRVPRGR
jgi:AraC family transcriptional regulator